MAPRTSKACVLSRLARAALSVKEPAVKVTVTTPVVNAPLKV